MRKGAGLPPDIEAMLAEHSVWIATAGAEGRRAVFSGHRLDGCNFSGCDLRGAELQEVSVEGADFSNAQLMFASFQGHGCASPCSTWPRPAAPISPRPS